MDFIDKLDLESEKKEHLEELLARIRSLMYENLYRHSVNTLKYGLELAGKQEARVDLYRLGVASILHDYGKIFSYDELAGMARKNNLDLSDFEINSHSLLHGLAGDFLASRDFDIKDEKILRSIKYHTIGFVGMDIEDKILFISDKIGEGRDYGGVERIREFADKSIDLCLLEVYKNNIIYIVKREKLLHPDTSRVWNSICGGIENVF